MVSDIGVHLSSGQTAIEPEISQKLQEGRPSALIWDASEKAGTGCDFNLRYIVFELR